jgi:hypothetical protein
MLNPQLHEMIRRNPDVKTPNIEYMFILIEKYTSISIQKYTIKIK